MSQLNIAAFLLICSGFLINGDWPLSYTVLAQRMIEERELFWSVTVSQAMLSVANFVLSGTLFWIYRRSPEIKEFWGPAGALSAIFAVLFFIKAIARVLTVTALFERQLWIAIAICDTITGFVAWTAAVSLVWAVFHPNGIKKLLKDRREERSGEHPWSS